MGFTIFIMGLSEVKKSHQSMDETKSELGLDAHVTGTKSHPKIHQPFAAHPRNHTLYYFIYLDIIPSLEVFHSPKKYETE